ncbi:unnamed protein product [Ceratitis capitata]|uniref:(Mediterranean fruit fly) hypothetical protein n=1 Tax=Ceratitis capitata TaxID=7213 RepID=A0A811UW79_CERCA|nr:unnamed protein product [Ceratitis capitata]
MATDQRKPHIAYIQLHTQHIRKSDNSIQQQQQPYDGDDDDYYVNHGADVCGEAFRFARILSMNKHSRRITAPQVSYACMHFRNSMDERTVRAVPSLSFS